MKDTVIEAEYRLVRLETNMQRTTDVGFKSLVRSVARHDGIA